MNRHSAARCASYERVERPRVACGVTQHQLRVGVAFSHRPQLYPEGAGGSPCNARRRPKVVPRVRENRWQLALATRTPRHE